MQNIYQFIYKNLVYINSLYSKFLGLATLILFFHCAWLRAIYIVNITTPMSYFIPSFHISLVLPLVFLASWTIILLLSLTSPRKYLRYMSKPSRLVLPCFILSWSNFLKMRISYFISLYLTTHQSSILISTTLIFMNILFLSLPILP